MRRCSEKEKESRAEGGRFQVRYLAAALIFFCNFFFGREKDSRAGTFADFEAVYARGNAAPAAGKGRGGRGADMAGAQDSDFRRQLTQVERQSLEELKSMLEKSQLISNISPALLEAAGGLTSKWP